MSIVEFKVPLHVEDLALDLDDRYTLHDRVGPPAHHTKQILAGRDPGSDVGSCGLKRRQMWKSG